MTSQSPNELFKELELTEAFGTSGNDSQTGKANEITWGLAGNDQLKNSGTLIGDEILIGGSGDDYYTIDDRGSIWIYEEANNGFDTLYLKDITIDDPSTYLFSIENSHLAVANYDPLQAIIVLDGLNNSGIDRVNLGGSIYSREDILDLSLIHI